MLCESVMARKLPRVRRQPIAPRGRYAAPALEKGLDILELFASESAGLTGSDVARRLGRSVGEIFRMLVCLERRGYICETDSDDRFELTLKLFELAHRHHPLDRLVAHARPLLQEVANHTGQSCHLAMLSDAAIIVVAQVDAPGSMGFSLRLGAQIDLSRHRFRPRDSRVSIARRATTLPRRMAAPLAPCHSREIGKASSRNPLARPRRNAQLSSSRRPEHQLSGIQSTRRSHRRHLRTIHRASRRSSEPKQIKERLQSASQRLTAGTRRQARAHPYLPAERQKS